MYIFAGTAPLGYILSETDALPAVYTHTHAHTIGRAHTISQQNTPRVWRFGLFMREPRPRAPENITLLVVIAPVKQAVCRLAALAALAAAAAALSRAVCASVHIMLNTHTRTHAHTSSHKVQPCKPLVPASPPPPPPRQFSQYCVSCAYSKRAKAVNGNRSV